MHYEHRQHPLHHRLDLARWHACDQGHTRPGRAVPRTARAAAGLLHRQIDSARVSRYLLASPTQEEGAPRFECDGCHRQFRLDQGADRLQGALQQVLRALARSGHQGQSVDIAVHGLCAGCAHPEPGA